MSNNENIKNEATIGSSPTFGANITIDNKGVTHVSENSLKDSPNKTAFLVAKTPDGGPEEHA